MKKFIRRFISAICIIAIVISGKYLVEYISSDRQGEKAVQKAAESLITEKVDEEEILKQEYRKKYPNIKFPDNLLLKYYPVYAQNQDLAGWISVPEYKVDYPIMQSTDNDYYLRKNIDKKYDVWGVPFFDYRNKFNPNDQNLIVFGHNSSQFKNKMFAALNAYATVEGFKKAPVIKCDSIYEEMYWKVYAVYITNSKSKDDNGHYFNYIVNKFSEDAFGEYLYEVKSRALYETGIDIKPDDHILTISTCNYSFKDARMVIVCRQIRPGESTAVDVSLAHENPNPKYPQAWYDAKKIKNPYK